MQGEEKIDQANPTGVNFPPDLYLDYRREAEEFRKRSEDPTRPTVAACSAINEANKKTEASSSSSRNREEEIPRSDQTTNRGLTSSRPLSANARPWRPQDHPVANQNANVVAVSSDQRQPFGMQQQQQQSDNAASWRAQNAYPHQPVANYVNQQQYSVLPIRYYPSYLYAAAPGMYNQQLYIHMGYGPVLYNQQGPYDQHPVANQTMPVIPPSVDQFDLIHLAPSNYAPRPELNQQTQQPTLSQRFYSGSSSQQGQDQQQQKPRGNDS